MLFAWLEPVLSPLSCISMHLLLPQWQNRPRKLTKPRCDGSATLTSETRPAEIATAAGHDKDWGVRLQRDGNKREISLLASSSDKGCQDEAATHHLHPWLWETLQRACWAQHTRGAWGNPVKETCATPQGKRTDWYFVRVGHSQTCSAGTAGETMHHAGKKRRNGCRI